MFNDKYGTDVLLKRLDLGSESSFTYKLRVILDHLLNCSNMILDMDIGYVELNKLLLFDSSIKAFFHIHRIKRGTSHDIIIINNIVNNNNDTELNSSV